MAIRAAMVVEEVMEEVTKTLSSHIFVILLYIMPIRTPCSWRHIPIDGRTDFSSATSPGLHI